MAPVRMTELAPDGKLEPIGGWSWPRINLNRSAAVVLWLMGAWLTEQTLTYRVSGWLAWPVALGIQLVLTRLESSLWHRWHTGQDGEVFKGVISAAAWPALILDTLFNFPGAYRGIVQSLHQFPPLVLIAELAHIPIYPIGGWAAILVTFALAVVPCSLPEYLWWQGEVV